MYREEETRFNKASLGVGRVKLTSKVGCSCSLVLEYNKRLQRRRFSGGLFSQAKVAASSWLAKPFRGPDVSQGLSGSVMAPLAIIGQTVILHL